MTTTQLSVKQFAILMLGQETGPWHLGRILKVYGHKFVSIRATLEALAKTPVTMFVGMRTGEAVAKFVQTIYASPAWQYGGVDGAPLAAWWQEFWSDNTENYPYAVASRANFLEFQKILDSVGASISYLNPPITLEQDGDSATIPAWTIIGITGTVRSLASLNATAVPFEPSKWSAAQWETLRYLKDAIVIVPAAGLNTATPLDDDGPFPGGVLDAGRAIATMMVVTARQND